MSNENRNYENDHRVIAGNRDDWYESFDEVKMLVVIHLLNEDEEEEFFELPVKFEVCPTCDGKGYHVNPSIDCCGLSWEDFNEDPYFAEDYLSGRYDVQCYECHGRRVVPKICEDALNVEQKGIVEKLEDRIREDASYKALCRAERIMGA